MKVEDIKQWIPEALSPEEECILEQELAGLRRLADLLQRAEGVLPLVAGWDVRI